MDARVPQIQSRQSLAYLGGGLSSGRGEPAIAIDSGRTHVDGLSMAD
jgi:hypothetical protein